MSATMHIGSQTVLTHVLCRECDELEDSCLEPCGCEWLV